MDRDRKVIENKKNPKNFLPLLFLVFGEAMLALNQTNISSIYLPISKEFNQGVYGLGVLTAVLFLSYGLFEVPGGILAIRTGPKKIALLGLGLNSFGVIASSFSSQFDILILMRFVSGIGSAFAFPTVLVLIVRQLKEGSEGLGSGWTVGWTSVGAAMGLILWPSLAQAEGWRLSILDAGLISLIPLTAITLLVEAGSPSPSVSRNFGIKRVITNRKLLLVGLVLFGAGEGFSVISNFLVYYLEQLFGSPPEIAGFLAAISSLVPIFISPLIGRAHDKVRRVRLYFLVAGIALACGVGIIAIHSFYFVIAGEIAVGFATGIFFTLGFALAKNSSPKESESLGVAWVDSFSLVGGIVSPIFFASIVLGHGYPVAWVIAGLGSFLPILPLLLLLQEHPSQNTQ